MQTDEDQANPVQVLGLYESFTAVDPVVEYLLDQGFSHTDIALLSGHYWTEILNSLGQPEEAERIPTRGREVYLQVTAAGEKARLARDILCNSGPLDVRVRRITEEQPDREKVSSSESLEQARAA